MSEKSKRPWFRFHLLTAVLMMFATGGFVGMNLGKQRTYIADYDVIGADYSPILKSYRSVGWPIRCDTAPQIIFLTSKNYPLELPNISYTPLYMDSLIGTVGLLAIAIASESFLRRRKDRKP